MAVVRTQVGDLYVEETGRPDGPPVLLWPSLYCTGAVFAEMAADLAPSYRVLVLDPPGHGRSGTPPARFSLADTAAATAEVLDALGVDQVALVGGAWGGMVGVQLAAQAPERISRLVLVNSPLDRWRGLQRVQMSGLGVLLRTGGPGIAAGMLVKNMLSPTTRTRRPGAAPELDTMIRGLDRTGLFRSARSAMLDRPSLLPVLPGLELPVLVLTGADDPLVPASRAEAEARLIRGSRFEAIPGTAHLSAYEAPDAVNALVQDFLAS